MRAQASVWCGALALLLSSADPARAQSEQAPAAEDDGRAAAPPPASDPAATPAPPVAEAASVEAARRHFANGVRLYQDANYSAALIEFEASNELVPGAASLQNIALCQKAMFRYAAAADTLDLLLSTYGSTLSANEQATVTAAKEELQSLTRHLRVHASPVDALVKLDGEPMTQEQLKAGLRVNVGEHQLSASAPGYATKSVPVRLASGLGPVDVKLRLEAVAGFVTIVTEQKGAAIAVDGRALDYDRWSGPLAPGEHVLQIYKAGHETVEEPFDVVVGERKVIRASAGGELEESGLAPEVQAQLRRGWYGMGAFNLMLVPDAPAGVTVDDSFNSGAVSWGARAGYRLLDPVGVEMLIEGGRTDVTGACIEQDDLDKWPGIDELCGDDQTDDLAYSITAFRLGGNMRLFSNGMRTRFTSTVGFGAVQHSFQLDQPDDDSKFDAQAMNAYVLVEIGVQFNLNRLLLEADFVTYLESRGSLGNDDHDELFNEGGIKSLGLGIKAGWSEWKPR